MRNSMILNIEKPGKSRKAEGKSRTEVGIKWTVRATFEICGLFKFARFEVCVVFFNFESVSILQKNVGNVAIFRSKFVEF